VNRQDRLCEARQQAEEDELQKQQGCKDEEEAAQLEERKKNKNKPKAGDYCELHYFTNKGLDNARVSMSITEPDVLVILPAADGIHSWVPAAAVKDLKAAPVVKDENLIWEDFNEAAPLSCYLMSYIECIYSDNTTVQG
ncbi:hypothetical protein BDR04DRAFT_1021682, partial [Suillus decipiens]